jgi:archaellum biogenesis ATPase FlaH
MNTDHARQWLEFVFGGLAGWIDLRAIDPDQKQPPENEFVRTTGEALAWCERWDGRGRNLYAGLARRGEAKNERGKLDGGEGNLLGCQVLWADLDDGDREDQLARARSFPVRPSMMVDSGGGLHLLWRLDVPIECASDPASRTHLCSVLKAIQLSIKGDPAVCDAPRIFRIAGTRNYPNGRKRAKGRVEIESSILEVNPYSVALEDFAELEELARELAPPEPTAVHGHGETMPLAVAHILEREKRMWRVFHCQERLQDGDASAEDFALAVGILRRAPWLADGVVVAALRYRRVALAHLVRGSQKSRSYFPSTVAKARAQLKAEAAAPSFETSPGRWFQHMLGKAITSQPRPEVQGAMVPIYKPPRIHTGLELLDHKTGGGIYGFTALAGDSGVGKSTIAFNVAMRAHLEGWRTLYIAAEMDAQDYQSRAMRYYGIRDSRILEKLPVVAHVSDGVALESIYDLVMTLPEESTERILIVIDSLTKVAAYTDSGGGGHSFFDAMNKLTRMCEAAVRYGDRRICALVTSELNKDRQALGMRIIYSASLVVQLSQAKDDPKAIYASIPKARYSAKSNQFGPYEYDWAAHRLRYHGTETVPQDTPIEEPSGYAEDIRNEVIF